MKTMRTLIAALAGACIGTATAYGQGVAPYYAPPQPINNGLPTQMAHNGSLMNVRWNGSVYEFSYADPRPSLWGVGVRPGTKLMWGNFQGSQFVGTAFMFTHHCGAVPYNVSGNYQNGLLTLFGPEPAIDRWCGVIGNKWDTNSTLVFTPWSVS